jgi:hypothetical protein
MFGPGILAIIAVVMLHHQMTESKYWSLKPQYSKLATTSDERG